MISPNALAEFKAIWEQEFGSCIDDELAIKEAIKLLTIFDTVYRPIRKDWIKNENEECKK